MKLIDQMVSIINEQGRYFKDITDEEKEFVIRQIINYSNKGIIKINNKIFKIKEVAK